MKKISIKRNLQKKNLKTKNKFNNFQKNKHLKIYRNLSEGGKKKHTLIDLFSNIQHCTKCKFCAKRRRGKI